MRNNRPTHVSRRESETAQPLAASVAIFMASSYFDVLDSQQNISLYTHFSSARKIKRIYLELIKML